VEGGAVARNTPSADGDDPGIRSASIDGEVLAARI
jgi:hypothetical protein